jgi:hypothetical protein
MKQVLCSPRSRVASIQGPYATMAHYLRQPQMEPYPRPSTGTGNGVATVSPGYKAPGAGS